MMGNSMKKIKLGQWGLKVKEECPNQFTPGLEHFLLLVPITVFGLEHLCITLH